MDDPKPYHHGNLREALIEAAIEILHESGVGDLSLRATAARAGVSRMAPTHHFGGKDGLLGAVAARAYENFAATMQSEFDRAEENAHEKMRAICKGYLMFARNEPALFDLILSDETRFQWTDELTISSAKSYEVLRSTCAMFKPSKHGPEITETLIWSLIHGYAALSRRTPVSQEFDFREIFAMLDELHLTPKGQVPRR